MAKIAVKIEANSIYLPVLEARQRVIVLYGGAGSGKSVAAADFFCVLKALRDPKRRILVVRKVARTIKESCFQLLRERIAEMGISGLWTVNRTDYSFQCDNGAQIISAGLDDIEKLKSIAGVTDIWIEEATELTEEEFDQLNIRLRGKRVAKMQILLSYNPISVSHWLKRRFHDQESEDVLVIHSTYKDNRHIDEQYKAELEKLRERNFTYYEVYALGKWGQLEQGRLFRRDNLRRISQIPSDARGVIYCDPNLAKKSKGDTTGISCVLYSPSLQLFILSAIRCRSFSQSSELLDSVFRMYSDRTRTIAFDGNFSQESHWSEHVRAYCRERGLPIPAIEYKRYRTNEIGKNTSILWEEGRIAVLEGIDETAEGREYFSQLFAFSGKSASSKDDAPDSLICAVEAVVDRGLATRAAISEQLKKIL